MTNQTTNQPEASEQLPDPYAQDTLIDELQAEVTRLQRENLILKQRLQRIAGALT